MEDKNANRNEDGGDLALEVSNGNKDSVRNWAKGHSCDSLDNTMALRTAHALRT